MRSFLDFEKPIAELEGKIEELRHLSMGRKDLNITEEIATLQKKSEKLLLKTYASLTPWQKVQIARHPDRPHFTDYRNYLFEEFFELSGDRAFGEDRAIIGGLALFQNQRVMVIGQEKGRTTEKRLEHNFGYARPEGYRKCQRLMELADHWGIPILSFIDTAGAYPGIDAEARGQAEAIASCIQACFRVRVPTISIVVGEGFSGGAIAIGTTDRILILEHAVYTVISPEGCASILWKDAEQKEKAAQALRLTAQDLDELGIVDEVILEPLGAAHRDPVGVFENVRSALKRHLAELSQRKPEELIAQRREKYAS